MNRERERNFLVCPASHRLHTVCLAVNLLEIETISSMYAAVQICAPFSFWWWKFMPTVMYVSRMAGNCPANSIHENFCAYYEVHPVFIKVSCSKEDEAICRTEWEWTTAATSTQSYLAQLFSSSKAKKHCLPLWWKKHALQIEPNYLCHKFSRTDKRENGIEKGLKGWRWWRCKASIHFILCPFVSDYPVLIIVISAAATTSPIFHGSIRERKGEMKTFFFFFIFSFDLQRLLWLTSPNSCCCLLLVAGVTKKVKKWHLKQCESLINH